MSKTMNIGIDHGYYAIKTRHFSFPAGISEYSHEPYTLQNTLEYPVFRESNHTAITGKANRQVAAGNVGLS